MKRKIVSFLPRTLNQFVLRFNVNDEEVEVMYIPDYKELGISNLTKLDIKGKVENDNITFVVFNDDSKDKLTIEHYILLLICTSLHLKYNTIDGTFIHEGKKHLIKDFAIHCNQFVQSKKSRRSIFYKKSKNLFLNWIKELEKIKNDSEKFTGIVNMLTAELYKSVKNKSYTFNEYLNFYLNEYINILAQQKNCYLGMITLNYYTNEIIAEPVETLIKRMERCNLDQKKLITVVINYKDISHMNHLIIWGNEVWKIEPNYRMGDRAEKLTQNKIDQLIQRYFENTKLIYRGPHQQSCGLEHSGLCLYISYFKVLYGNALTDQLLKESIISFLKWVIQKICSNWNIIKEKLK
jgi:hypothetical protein